MRLVGIVLTLIGYFYISSTIWDRFALPFVLMPAAIWGECAL
jgi:hypothetical protein